MKIFMPNMIFVGGTGRSGTSIVKEALANHPDAASLPFEYRFIIDPDGLVDFYASFTATWSPYLADRRLKRLEGLLNSLAHEPLRHRFLSRLIRRWNRTGRILSPRAYHGWELNRHLPNFEQHTQTLMSKLIEFSFPACWVGTESYQLLPRIYHSAPRQKEELARILGDFIQVIIDDLLKVANRKFFVEDNTWNILLAKEILELVPEAKIIHVYRDPRDVVASFSRQRWSPIDRTQGAHWYKSMMGHWFNLRSSLPTGSFYELKLEDLVTSPAEVLQNVCTFAGIPFDRVILQTDLSHSHSGRWKREYSKEEKAKVQAILAEVIETLGYGLVR
jgi:hypothetical protein